MAEFMIRFFICNILISFMIGMLLLAKHLLKNNLTSRMHYNLKKMPRKNQFRGIAIFLLLSYHVDSLLNIPLRLCQPLF